MLEDRLRDDTNSQPVESSRELLEFVQNRLPSGGQQAVNRFFNLVKPTCDAVLGKVGGEADHYRHLHGGWMSEKNPWIRLTTHVAGVVPSIPHPGAGGVGGTALPSVRDLDNDPVVKLLGTAGEQNPRFEPIAITLIEALSLQAEKYPSLYLEYPFLALPKTIQDAWLDVIGLMYAAPPGVSSAAESICSENDIKLFSNLLRINPSGQDGLRLYMTQQKNKVPTTRQQPLYSNNPGVFHTPPQSPTFSSPAVDEDAPMAYLSILEYYLLSFLRYPLFLPDPATAISRPLQSIPGVNIHHIPSQRMNISVQFSTRPKYGEEVYLHVLQKYLLYFIFSPTGSTSRFDERFATSEESALFLSLITALWLESTVRLVPEAKAQQDWQESRMRANAAHAETNLATAHDLIQLQRHPFKLPNRLMLSGLRLLVLHLIRGVPPVPDHARGGARPLGPPWNIDPNMGKLQQPFYNFIRGSFRFMTVSSTESWAFQESLNIWLIWLEPWNRRAQRQPNAPTNLISTITRNTPAKKPIVVVDIPRHDHPSKYDANWEPYIAANLFIYLVPLAIFVRRARELDFTSKSSFQTVSRVFRVFTPEVVSVLRRHLDATQQGSPFGDLVEQHRTLLGPFCPTGKLQLSSLELDFRKLFEDIGARHARTGQQNIPPLVQSWFESGKGDDRKVMRLMERAIVIAQLPIDTDLLTSQRSRNAAATGTHVQSLPIPHCLPNGELSDLGRDQIRMGIARFPPDDITYVGDYMRRMAGTHEPELWLYLVLLISDVLSDRLGLDKERPGHRVNLRWLADYRHLLFAIFAVTAMKVLFF